MIKYLKSNQFALIVAIISILAQLPHTYFVFHSISRIEGFWAIAQGLIFAIAIDASLIFYTLRNRKDVAKFFAGIMIAINLLYYWNLAGLSSQFVAGIIVSILIPVSIYYYSEEIKETVKPALDGKIDIKEIKRLRVEGFSYKQIGEMTGINPGSVHRMVNRC